MVINSRSLSEVMDSYISNHGFRKNFTFLLNYGSNQCGNQKKRLANPVPFAVLKRKARLKHKKMSADGDHVKSPSAQNVASTPGSSVQPTAVPTASAPITNFTAQFSVYLPSPMNCKGNVAGKREFNS